MAKTKKRNKTDVPGTIYQRNNRYWWKVQLPGENKPISRALKPVGSRFATSDFSVAIETAKNILQEAVYKSACNIDNMQITNVASLVSAYIAYVDGYYLDANGKPTREPEGIRYALKPLTKLFASMPIEDFGPLSLINVRDHMITQNWSRRLINQRICKIRRMFKWAVSRQIISPVIYQGLTTVEGLKRGRSAAKELPKRKPVPEEYVYAILPYTTPVVSAMIELQLLTGMRPGEMVIMRPSDIDRTDEVWHYYPEKHKNLYRETERIVSIGPRGQQLLIPYLLRKSDSYCFSPIESEDYRRKELTENRKTPLSCGNKVGSNQKENPDRTPGDCYDTASYRKAVTYAIRKANAAIKKQARAAGKEPQLIPNWTPYQLRHTAATKVRREMGYESAGAALGHTNMSATAIYAERNQGLADEAAKKFG